MRKILVIVLSLWALGAQAQQSVPAIRGEINTYFPTNNAKQIQAAKLRETFNDVLDHVDTLNKKKYGKTIAQIRAINNDKYEIVYVLDSLKQGWFYYDNDDTSTTDDGNNTLVSANGYRYKRSIILAPVVSVNGLTGVVTLTKDDIFGIDSIETKDIKSDAVTYSKIQNVATNQRALGRTSGAGGNVEELSLSQMLDWASSTQGVVLYRGASGWAPLGPGTSGQVLTTGGAAANPSWASALPAANSITNTMLRQSVGLSLLGRSANTMGDIADITAANDGEVLRRSGTSIGFGAVATAGIANSAVTYAKIQNVSATNRLLGRSTAGAGAVEEITVGGDISQSGSTFTIGSGAVTYAKIQNISTTQRVIGRNTAGAGVTEEVSASGVLDWIGSTRGQILFRGASGWSALATGTAGQVLQTNGAGADPSWGAAPGSPFASDISVNGINIGRGGGNVSTNIRLGVSALSNNSTGTDNVAIGNLSLASANSTGSYNTAVGSLALNSLTSGSASTAVGGEALRFSTGNLNVGIGRGAGYDLTSGNYNTIIGVLTGRGITTGGSNTIIGSSVTGLSSSLANNIIIADGDGNRRINVDASGRVGIGTNTPSTAAQLDITSTTGGILFPRMTTTQRDAISTPPDGLVVYNSTTNKLQVRAAGAWVDLH